MDKTEILKALAHPVRFALEVVDAVAKEIGAGRVGIRLSPVTPGNNITESRPQAVFDHLVRKLGSPNLSFIHVIEGATGGDRNFTQGGRPFD